MNTVIEFCTRCGSEDCRCGGEPLTAAYRHFLHMLNQMTDSELRGERKPRIRVKAGSRKLPG